MKLENNTTKVSLFILFVLSLADRAQAQKPAGFDFIRSSCTVNGRRFDIESLLVPSNSSIEVRVERNPTVKSGGGCSASYRGQEVDKFIQTLPNFQTVAAINANFYSPSASSSYPGYRSIGYLWSRSKTLAPLTKKGDHLVLKDRFGVREEKIDFQATPSTSSLTSALLRKYPSLEWAMQLHLPLLGGKIVNGKLQHYTQCSQDMVPRRSSASNDSWACPILSRTALCVKRNGDLSLMTVHRSRIYDLAVGMREGGACQTECAVLYNLDGGGSTQMALRNESNQKFEKIYSAIAPSSSSVCPKVYRPVDNYFLLGRSTATTAF